MTRSHTAAVSRRRIISHLRKLRSDAHETQGGVADAIGWSPAKLMRIEGGKASISTTDLMALLTHYGVYDKAEVKQLLETARDSRSSTLADTFGKALSKRFADYLEDEEAARVIRHFEPKLIPGPLQTENYARAVLAAYANDQDSQEVIEQRVATRLARRDQLLRPGGPESIFIIDETVLWRQIGAEAGRTDLMTRQIEDMAELARNPNVNIQIIPFGVGAYPAMCEPFVILEFDEPPDERVLYLKNSEGSPIRDETLDRVYQYLHIFFDLEKRATKTDKLSEVLNKALAIYRRKGGFGIAT